MSCAFGMVALDLEIDQRYLGCLGAANRLALQPCSVLRGMIGGRQQRDDRHDLDVHGRSTPVSSGQRASNGRHKCAAR